MLPFWSQKIKHTVLLPKVFLLRWGITGKRLHIYLTLLGLLILSLIYLVSYVPLKHFYGGFYEYTSFYCASPGPVHGDEGVLKQSHKHLYKIVQVQSVIRHGDRAPINTHAMPSVPPVSINCMFNETDIDHGHKLVGFKAAQDVFIVNGGDHPIIQEAQICSNGQLSPYGFLQHIFNGEHLRKSYSSLLEDNFAYKQTQVYSTDYDRTVQSASALLYGIFKNKMDITKHSFDINVIQKNSEADFMLTKDGILYDCPNLLKKVVARKDNLEIRAVNSVANLQLELYAKLLKVDVSTMPKISKVVDVMATRLCHNLGIPDGKEGPLPKDLIESSFQLSHRYITADHAPVYELQTTALLSHVAQNIVDLYNGDSNARFILYSGHDSTLVPLLLNLGASDKKWPPYASRVIFELWELENFSDPSTSTTRSGLLYKVRNSFIRILYNGRVITSKVRFCKHLIRDELCPVEDFLNFVSLSEPNNNDYFKRIFKLCNLSV